MKFIFSVVRRFLLAYAVLFSIVGTIILATVAVIIGIPVFTVKTLAFVNPGESAFMKDYKTILRHSGKADTLSHVFVPIDSISINLQNAVLAAEDDAFYVHPGIDINAVLDAYNYNLERRRIKRGASTLTQQLAKNLFLNGDRTFNRKYKELMYTLLMENFLGKKRILELYLNYAQWGKTIFGCEAASRHYFGKSAKNLSTHEAARLAAVLVAPARLSPTNASSGFMQRRLAVIATNLYSHSSISADNYRDITNSEPPAPDSNEILPNADSTDNGSAPLLHGAPAHADSVRRDSL